MMLTHQCPSCGKLHDKDCTPEPDKPCPDCEAIIDYSREAEEAFEKAEAIKEMDEAEKESEDDLECEELEPNDEFKCKCGFNYRILYDHELDEIHLICRAETCQDYYLSKQEFDYDVEGAKHAKEKERKDKL